MRKNHSPKQIIRYRSVRVQTRRKRREVTCLITNFEPRSIKATLDDEFWINALNEEIDQFENNNTWTLLLRLFDKNVIGKKCIFIKKLNENGEVVRNKARLVYTGYAQEEII